MRKTNTQPGSSIFCLSLVPSLLTSLSGPCLTTPPQPEVVLGLLGRSFMGAVQCIHAAAFSQIALFIPSYMSLLPWEWESTFGTRTMELLTYGSSSGFLLEAAFYIKAARRLCWHGCVRAHMGTLLELHTGRSAASHPRDICSTSILLCEVPTLIAEEAKFSYPLTLSLSLSPWKESNKTWEIQQPVSMTFICLAASANPLYPFMKKRELKWQQLCRCVCPKSSWQERWHFAPHQIT